MRFGVPASGPMDRLAHAAANAAIGNDVAATAIEISVGGLVLECLEGPVTMAVAGGGFVLDQAGHSAEGWRVFTLRTNERLAIRAGSWGSWSYLAVAGEFDVPRWLGHTATHAPSGLGGGTLRTSQEIEILDARTDPQREGAIPTPEIARPTGRAGVVMGPQDHHFQDQAIASFVDEPFNLTEAYDRMGVRLDGTPLSLREVLSIPSEPIIRGSVQVAGDGVATVLLADHQTTGGYPKIATVVSTDIDRFSQLRPGDTVRFVPTSASAALLEARRHRDDTASYLASISKADRSLAHRLMNRNLVTWGTFIEDDD